MKFTLLLGGEIAVEVTPVAVLGVSLPVVEETTVVVVVLVVVAIEAEELDEDTAEVPAVAGAVDSVGV